MSSHLFQATAYWEDDRLVIDMKPKEEGKGKAQKHIRYLEDENTLVLVGFHRKKTVTASYCRMPPHMGLRGFGGVRTIKRRAPCMGDLHTQATHV